MCTFHQFLKLVFLLQKPSFVLLLGLVIGPSACPALRPEILPVPSPAVLHLSVYTAVSLGRDSFTHYALIRFFPDLPNPQFL